VITAPYCQVFAVMLAQKLSETSALEDDLEKFSGTYLQRVMSSSGVDWTLNEG